MSERYEFDTPDYCRILYRYSKPNPPYYEGGEFLDIYIKAACPECPDDGSDIGILEFTEDKEIVAKCPKCGYSARVSVYEEGA